MRPTFMLVWLFLSFFSLFLPNIRAQECPDPQNLTIKIEDGTPPIAHVGWTIPPKSGVIGFSLTYSINGGAPVTVTLPPSPTAYSFPIPRGWETVEVNLTSICSDGSQSRNAFTKLRNIIIVDIILARTTLQEHCAAPCPTSSHFYYGPGSSKKYDEEAVALGEKYKSDNGIKKSDPPSKNSPGGDYETYNTRLFCNCMTVNGNAYGNPTVVNGCHWAAIETLSRELYYLTLCNTLNRENDSKNSAVKADWDLSLAPNPVSDQLRIQHNMGETQTLNCLIVNVNGQEVAPQFTLTADQTIETSAWMPGVYFVKVTKENGEQKTFRILK